MSTQKEPRAMEKIIRTVGQSLPALPKLHWTPLLEDAVAFAVLGGGGYIALRIMDLIFRLLGVA